MEFKSGFDATPYMDSSAWGKPKYKKVTDPDTGLKVYTGNGLDIHPNKKDRYKLQGEKNPDVKTIVQGSTRAAVAIKRRKGSDYIPVIEASAKVVPATPIEGYRKMPTGWNAEENAKQTEVSIHNAKILSARRIVPTDTPEYTYKVFRLLSSDLVERAKRRGLTPAQFYRQHHSELTELAHDAASRTGVERERFATYIREHAAKLADALEGESGKATPKSSGTPGTLEDAQKKLAAATRRRDKAQREMEELITLIEIRSPVVIPSEATQTVEEIRDEFRADMATIDRDIEAKPEPDIRGGARLMDKNGHLVKPWAEMIDTERENLKAYGVSEIHRNARVCGEAIREASTAPKPEPSSAVRKSKKQIQREDRRAKRRAKRSGRKISERIAA